MCSLAMNWAKLGRIPSHEKKVAIIFHNMPPRNEMKTCGDDIAEILYLMGIKPKWLENTDRVIGLEVMPPEELGRPRIDVTLRITGLFRDTFPNIIELVEDADVTVKNESSTEIDMLEDDDFYNYHGGLIAAVKTHSGKTPRAYSGDSSDPSRTKVKDVNEETARIMRAKDHESQMV